MELDYRSSLKGVTDSRYTGKVLHFRGIQYANITKRFAKPILNEAWASSHDCTKFGPRCPQPPANIRAFMQIPNNIPNHDFEQENELACANLNVTCPDGGDKTDLPVLLWIYGGSQVNSFGSAAQKLGDAGPLVAQSVEQRKPIILVTINYRLNLFAFGERDGEQNLDLQDQRIALHWVKRYISGFGGDPGNITLGGHSAGAIYVHALLASGSNKDVKRAILDSGCLYTHPPQPEKRCLGILGVVESNLALIEMENGNLNPSEAVASSLAGAPADRLVQTLQDLSIESMWMWPEVNLKNWDDDEKTFAGLSGVLIGDVDFEASEDEDGLAKLTRTKILEAFQTVPTSAGEGILKEYNVNDSDERACRKATLNFLNDAYYAFPLHDMCRTIAKAGTAVYQSYFDQPNPFANPETARAHHGVDLFAIFGGYDGFVGNEMKSVGNDVREKWIDFINGAAPWVEGRTYAFGPKGMTGLLDDADLSARRRIQQFASLQTAGLETYQVIWQKLQAAMSTA